MKNSEHNLTDREKRSIRRAIRYELLENPPTIGLVGVSGVGKSSTINTLFRTDLTVSHTVAGTKKFDKVDLSLTVKPESGTPTKTNLRVYDAPGLGEDIRKDEEYIEMYKEVLPTCDVILWIMAAPNRAIALDERYLLEFKSFFDKMVFGLCQVDLVAPMNWQENLPIPSTEQETNIREIVADRTEKFQSILGREVKMIPYSNVRGYNLDELFLAILEAAPPDRAWIFQGLKGFNSLDFVPDNFESKSGNFHESSLSKPKFQIRFVNSLIRFLDRFIRYLKSKS